MGSPGRHHLIQAELIPPNRSLPWVAREFRRGQVGFFRCIHNKLEAQWGTFQSSGREKRVYLTCFENDFREWVSIFAKMLVGIDGKIMGIW